jgi:hypothetical protein
MGQEIIYDADTGAILAVREIAAPRDDLAPGEGQRKIFLGEVDFEGRSLAAFRVNPERGTVEPRADFAAAEADVELALTSDAAARSPIDGIPEIAADGNSSTTITIQKRSTRTGDHLRGAGHRNRVSIRTTAGTLSARQVSLERGEATFTLRSSAETVVAEVRVWAEGIPRPATISVEFAPVP